MSKLKISSFRRNNSHPSFLINPSNHIFWTAHNESSVFENSFMKSKTFFYLKILINYKKWHILKLTCEVNCNPTSSLAKQNHKTYQMFWNPKFKQQDIQKENVHCLLLKIDSSNKVWNRLVLYIQRSKYKQNNINNLAVY